MKILFSNLLQLAEHAEAFCTKGCSADQVTADLLWCITGRLRYRADQLEKEEIESPNPVRTLGSAIRDKVRKTGQPQPKPEDESAPARHRTDLSDSLTRFSRPSCLTFCMVLYGANPRRE